MIEKLIDLFEYTHHYNQEVIRIIIKNISIIDDRTIALINHTLNAQHIWNSRVLGDKPFEVWQIHPLDALLDIDHQNFIKSIHIIQKFDLESRIGYRNSKGEKFENSIFEMLFQIINHSTYHRGQVNAQLKQSGVAPILTDYIFYKR